MNIGEKLAFPQMVLMKLERGEEKMDATELAWEWLQIGFPSLYTTKDIIKNTFTGMCILVYSMCIYNFVPTHFLCFKPLAM